MSAPANGGRDPRRVALLIPTYPPEVSRGAERVVGELARGLVARDCVPRVVTGSPGAAGGSTAIEDGFEVTRVRRAPERPLLARGFESHLTHLPWSYAALCSGDDALAHAHFHTDALAALRWARERDRPVVLSFHGLANRETAAARRLRLAILARALEGADRVVVSSRAAAEAMERWFGVEATPIHPGVREEFFAARAERSERPTIVCAADPDDPRKRLALLVGAFGEVRRSRSDAELLIVRPSRRDLAERYEATPGVRMFERTAEPAALASIYARSWVSALASHSEAFGLVLAEALACGTPGVGASDGGVPELLGNDHDGGSQVGRLFERDDEAGLARALAEALELAEDGATAERCRERAGEFGVDRMCDAHLAIYRELTV